MIIDLNDAYAISICFGLYEYYNKMKEKLNGLIYPDDFPDIDFTFILNVHKPIEILKTIIRLIKSLLTYFRQDDLLGNVEIKLDLTNREEMKKFGYPREYKIRGHYGIYDVTLDLSIIEE